MKIDIRRQVAKFYDMSPTIPCDIPFYRRFVNVDMDVLELGCGTGRVLAAAAPHCRSYWGIDCSASMLCICRKKIRENALAMQNVKVYKRNISRYNLNKRFDLIIAPFRVMQNLETKAQVRGLFSCIRKHLKVGGSAILNVFKPLKDRDSLIQDWSAKTETPDWEAEICEGRLKCCYVKGWVRRAPLIIYPKIIYRLFRGKRLFQKAILEIPMRCYYPGEFKQLVLDNGFKIIRCWGGYRGESYGKGPELVIQFKK
jgi:ubiquinone/menaquinone biosynthesis C-methylase UbiE